MRSPRALIPLLSVCAAAAVVAAAATGAGIKDLPGDGRPAYADGAAAPRPEAVTVNAMSWNVCGDARPGCPLGSAPGDLGEQVVQRMGSTEVGGREVSTNAVLLQEVCEGHVRDFKKALGTWSWAFAPLPGGPSCAQDHGRLGLAIGTDAPLEGTEEADLPAPPGQAHVALCGEVSSWTTRLCVTQFSASEGSEARRKKARALVDLAGTGRVLVGGDLADTPDSRALDPLYDAYAECDQSGSSRTGANTRQNWQGTAVDKTDYLFVTKSAGVSCSVPT
ncbi:endonuclease/exonuclease/phosphatase family protein, partial [Actinomadura sp. KC345]|uniref:endonuclease/exonuclease/phosphatase family protein n=1 Tax=Actinomadura sp. KC345 TaxID=2530371 RepID=UPI001049334F